MCIIEFSGAVFQIDKETILFLMITDEHEQEDRFYDGILRKVLWGESKEGIMHNLEANGIPPVDAERLYQKAVSERVSAIRSIHLKQIFIGLALILTGCGSLWGVYYLTEGFTVWSVQSILIPAAPAGFGLWRFLDGLAGYLTAAGRTGPVADIA